VIQQPLSDLAVEIIKEALATDDQQFAFESPMYKGQPIHRKAMADALRGTKHETNKDKTKIELRFVCGACGNRGAGVKPAFESGKPPQFAN